MKTESYYDEDKGEWVIRVEPEGSAEIALLSILNELRPEIKWVDVSPKGDYPIRPHLKFKFQVNKIRNN